MFLIQSGILARGVEVEAMDESEGPLPGREAGLLPLERLVEVHTVVQLGVIIMRAGIEQEGLSSTDFPRITNVAKSGLQKSTGQGQRAPFGLHQGQQGFAQNISLEEKRMKTHQA